VTFAPCAGSILACRAFFLHDGGLPVVYRIRVRSRCANANDDGQSADGLRTARSGDGISGQPDWSSLTKLAATALADELASFYGCTRVKRDDLTQGRFAGAEMSMRFLREGRLFPYESAGGIFSLAVAAPVDEETLRSIEIALRNRRRAGRNLRRHWLWPQVPSSSVVST